MTCRLVRIGEHDLQGLKDKQSRLVRRIRGVFLNRR